jgi:hypothetical protein
MIQSNIMGASGKMFAEMREKYLIEVSDEYYKEHYEVFKHPNTKHIKTIIEGEDEMFKDDPTHKALFNNYMKASKALRDYKYDKRHNHK